jgi:hypothetical protein
MSLSQVSLYKSTKQSDYTKDAPVGVELFRQATKSTLKVIMLNINFLNLAQKKTREVSTTYEDICSRNT